MDAIEQSSAFNALAHLTRVPIAQLSPDLDNLAGKSFLANVVLVWPYSSSAKSFSLLLVEPDVLLRHAQGQIKVTFHGRVAEKIAESHVGIGATICLALKDCKFLNNAELQQAPGRCVAWEAHFENGVSLEVFFSPILSVQSKENKTNYGTSRFTGTPKIRWPYQWRHKRQSHREPISYCLQPPVGNRPTSNLTWLLAQALGDHRHSASPIEPHSEEQSVPPSIPSRKTMALCQAKEGNDRDTAYKETTGKF